LLLLCGELVAGNSENSLSDSQTSFPAAFHAGTVLDVLEPAVHQASSSKHVLVNPPLSAFSRVIRLSQDLSP